MRFHFLNRAERSTWGDTEIWFKAGHWERTIAFCDYGTKFGVRG